MLAAGPTETANCQEAEEHERHASHVDSCSAEVREQKPADDATDNVTRGKGNVDVECLEFRKASCFEKDDRESKNGVAAKDLGSPNNTVLHRGGGSQRDLPTRERGVY